MINAGLEPSQLAALKKTLREHDLTPARRNRLLKRVAHSGIVAASKRNQRREQFPDGRQWPARKRGKKKLLANLPRLLAVQEMPGGDAVRIYLRSRKPGKISAGALGYIHATGTTVTVNAASLPSRSQKERAATKKQARHLRKLGYKRRQDKRWVVAGISWIMEHLSQGQAGVIIREMSGILPATSWKIDVPSRVFLGVSDDEFNKILARQLRSLEFGSDVKPQDIRGKQ